MPRSTPPRNLQDYEKIAARKIKPTAWNYIAGGAGDESGFARCRADLDAVRLVSRVLRGIDKVDTSLDVLGQRIAAPILVAPSAYHGIVHPRGEVETARGVKAADSLMVLSTLCSQDVEHVAPAAEGRLWYQLYCYRDRDFIRKMIDRAETAGCRALVVTVDLPVVGTRYRDSPGGFKDPVDSQLARMLPKGTKPDQFFEENRYAGLCWDDLEWMRAATSMPILLKGVLSPEDAKMARDRGVAGIIVSTHGARQLDALVSPVEVLPAIRKAVGDSMLVLVDSGIRSGSDILRCLCLGADATLIGRPALWGLSAGGAAGVTHVLQILQEEFRRGMAILGARSIVDLGRHHVFHR